MKILESTIPHRILTSKVPNRIWYSPPHVVLYNKDGKPFQASIDLRKVLAIGRTDFTVHLFFGGQWHNAGVLLDDDIVPMSEKLHSEHFIPEYRTLKLHWAIRRGLSVLVNDLRQVKYSVGSGLFKIVEKYEYDDCEDSVILAPSNDGTSYCYIGTENDMKHNSKCEYARPFSYCEDDAWYSPELHWMDR